MTPQERYAKENTVGIYIRLNKKNDADILAALAASGNKQGYIKRLIRQDLAKKG